LLALLAEHLAAEESLLHGNSSGGVRHRALTASCRPSR
jgi:hypothetical protein